MLTYIGVILIFSILLQLAASIYALLLIRITGIRSSWVLIAAALILMCVRRIIPLYYLFLNADYAVVSYNEIIGLLVSLCMLLGVRTIGTVFLERSEAHKALLQISRYSRNLIEASHDPLVTINSEGKITDSNKATENVTGVSHEGLLGSDFTDYFTDPEKAREGYGEVFHHGYVKDYPLSIKHLNGKITDVLYNASLYRNEDGSMAGVFAAARDVSERKRIEDEVKSLLAEKELILREVHHRIKNNMNTIKGLLFLQADSTDNLQVAAALHDAENRITSMLLLYEKLYCSIEYGALSIKEYFFSLIDEIISNFPDNSIVKIEKNIEDFILDIKKLSSLGIIMNELLTNIMKHAFIGRENGIISVSASLNGSHAILVIADNGVGITESINFENSTGFGMQLIGMLTEQIGGSIRIERGGGTKFILDFEV